MSTKSIVYIDQHSDFYGTEVNILVGVAYITLFGRGVMEFLQVQIPCGLLLPSVVR